VQVVEGILNGWDKTFGKGIKAKNYVGDIFGTLGGTPDFGPGSIFTTMRKRGRRVSSRTRTHVRVMLSRTKML